MSDGARLNARQAKALAKLIEDEATIDDLFWIENEYGVGASDLIKASFPADQTGRHEQWLIGADGGVIKL